ncbi:MAG: SCO family protein [bacterium]|nr:SCO family protein [bacterium]
MRRFSAALVIGLGLVLTAAVAPPLAAGSLTPLPPFELDNWDGRRLSDASLEGKTTLVAFTYAKCVYACPMITFLLKDLDGELGSPQDVSYLHVSVNPAADTRREILKHFKKHEIDPRKDPRWLFLNGPEDGIAELLAALEIEVERKRVKGGEIIEHTILVLVLAPDGRTVAGFDTYHWDTEEMADALRLARGHE